MTFKCMECGRKFRTAKAAERAADKGCPGCGGVDIDMDAGLTPKHKTVAEQQQCPNCRAGQWCSLHNAKLVVSKPATYNSLKSLFRF